MNRKTTEHYAGCLLGGAVGDALGAAIEFQSLDEIRSRYGPAGLTDYAAAHSGGDSGAKGGITDDTQMTLFTAEGLLRAYCRGMQRGFVDPLSVIHHAYIRWLHTQGFRSRSPFDAAVDDGWLITLQALHSPRAPGSTCLSALQSGVMGTIAAPLNSSKGCGGVMRIAPVGLFWEGAQAFDMGCEIAAITHGHPSGYLSAGYLACVIAGIIAGESIRGSIDAALPLLAGRENREECWRAITDAVRLADDESVAPAAEVVERLGQGWVAEEALAISLYCALVARGDFSRGVLLAVNHSGDSDSTGAITGNILGALLGTIGVPSTWLEELELREEIASLAGDLLTRFRDDDAWRARYPGW
ncbi:MAG: ADP-ribosylglycohydrolase family protein [Bryobacteraceae bacterium]|nr:ADP-ribosylglycohydrolase family protein [Bryobacteraceae bacterium]